MPTTPHTARQRVIGIISLTLLIAFAVLGFLNAINVLRDPSWLPQLMMLMLAAAAIAKVALFLTDRIHSTARLRGTMAIIMIALLALAADGFTYAFGIPYFANLRPYETPWYAVALVVINFVVLTASFLPTPRSKQDTSLLQAEEADAADTEGPATQPRIPTNGNLPSTFS